MRARAALAATLVLVGAVACGDELPRRPPPLPSETSERSGTAPRDGATLYAERGCPTCHAPGAPGGGPSLDGLDARLSRESAIAWLLDPASVRPETTMPDLDLSPEEASAIVDFLFAANAGTGPAEPGEAAEPAAEPTEPTEP